MLGGSYVFASILLVLVAGVSANPIPNEGDIRLADGASDHAGRVEIHHNGEWGTVCDDNFIETAATLVCNQLGIGGTGVMYSFGPGSGPIWLDGFYCDGSESGLDKCVGVEWGRHDCSHDEDAGVVCETESGEEGQLRFGDGGESEGRLEIFHDSVWGTICDDGFENTEANVACRQMGYTGGEKAAVMTYGSGVSKLWLDEVVCFGSESSLTDCSHDVWGSHNCEHSEDVGVICSGQVTVEPTEEIPEPVTEVIPETPQQPVRLVGGTDHYGRLEVFHDGVWGTVCDDGFDEDAVRVACRTLGWYGGILAFYGEGEGTIWLDNLSCEGSESNLLDCPHSGWGIDDCEHYEDVSIECETSDNGVPPSTAIRLVDGGESYGRLEVLHQGIWGTVCDDGLTDMVASVLCRQLGFPDGGEVRSGAAYGEGCERIWLDEVFCPNASLDHIDSCSHNPWGSTDCSHAEDVGVVCYVPEPENTIQEYEQEEEQDGDLRLVDGDSATSGRLEVYHNDMWGTICDDGFRNMEAAIACKQMGFHGGRAHTEAFFGAGIGTIWLDQVACAGVEERLTDCHHATWGEHNCQHDEDVAVTCDPEEPVPATQIPENAVTGSTSQDGDVRIVEGESADSGRLEIFYGGAWGTVCDDSFGDIAATVACTQLGYRSGRIEFGGNPGAEGVVIWLDDIMCLGTENSLADCQHSDWGVHNCRHPEDVSITCALTEPDIDPDIETNQEPGNEGDLRLIRLSEDADVGRVEIYHDSAWGTVCDDRFGPNEVTVACKQLGYTQGEIQYCDHEGRGQIWLDEVSCSGSEAALTACNHGNWGDHNCAHYEDVCLRCELVTLPPEFEAQPGTDGELRLVGSGSSGRLEVFYNGTWGTVCDDFFTNPEATVACRELGFSGGFVDDFEDGAENRQIWLDDVYCDGTETRLVECTHTDWGAHNCNHPEDVGLTCYMDTSTAPVPTDVIINSIQDLPLEGPAPQPGNEGEVRLVNGGVRYGRLEVYHDGVWGTVCDDDFDEVDATVVCRQLGYPSGFSVSYGEGSGSIHLSHVSCTGSEERLMDCWHGGWGEHNCEHYEDVGIHCSSVPGNSTSVNEGEVRLSGGSDGSSGRVEVNHEDVWGTLCDDTFEERAAHVVCRQLGFHSGVPAPINHFGPGAGPIWLDDFDCEGNENTLIECKLWFNWGDHDCTHDEDAGVICVSDTATGQEGALRLVGGDVRSGRLEIFHNNTWGTICDDGFGAQEAQVACAQLGFSGGTARGEAAFGAGSEPIWLDQVTCSGSEDTLSGCHHEDWGSHNCMHEEDVSVECDVGPPSAVTPATSAITLATSAVTPATSGEEMQVRLSGADPGSDESRKGYLEVLHDDVWGSVCNDGFRDVEAHVVCRALGFLTGFVENPLADSAFHDHNHPIWLDSVRCASREAEFSECSHEEWGEHDCDHSEDVYILCLPEDPNNSAESPQDWDVRVAGGDGPNEGRVEVYRAGSWDINAVGGDEPIKGRVKVTREGAWGTVCDDGWTERETRVVCRQLGFTDGLPKLRGFYGPGEGDIWLDEVVCEGSEESLSECQSNGWAVHNCGHNEDAGVKCW